MGLSFVRFSRLPRASAAIAALFGAALLAAAPAGADTLLPSVFGKGNDFDDPLDGVADEVLMSIDTEDLYLNAVPDAGDPLPADQRGIAEFDLGVTTAVVSAVLELSVLDAVTAVGSVEIYAYAGNNALDLSDFAETGLLAGTPAVVVPVTSLDVTDAVNAILGGGGSVVGFLIRVPAEGQLLSLWRPGASQVDPQLVFTAVPEPDTALLAMAGLAALGARRFSAPRSRRR